MSLRGTKRASGVRGEEAGASKRRRMDPEDALWQLRPVSDLKMSSIYNRSASEAPAELFRKDLISAMKLPDSEPLAGSEYWVITDTWKQDWERGVQVPVNPDSLPAPKVQIIKNILPPNFQEFKLPKDKYIHLTRDIHYQSDKHHLSTSSAKAEAACSYDLDATDTSWLKLHNAERARAGASPVTEDQLEKVIEKLELKTWEKIQDILKSEEGLGIEYDENVICDVCRSPDSEDGNEMVFCDSCNICVHQACYGITVIPDGQWLCRPCNDSVRPTCVLCPNLGGAMKCTPSGHKWAHVSCVLWIPEVSIGCAEKMEPITKISSIPPSRWSLVCVLCRERTGACIQCSVKTCKTAYHVTCAFKHGLEMRAIIEDENADDGVKLRSYCQKHSVNSKKEKCPGSGSEEEEVKRKRRKDMTSEEKNQARSARLQEIEKEFDRHVTVKDISTHLLDIDQDAINYIYNYWKLKRRAGHNGPLLPPKSDDSELITHRQEQADLDKMKKFVQLRQDLERVRNLCYMVSRREKLSRSFFRMREQTFHKQVAVISSDTTMSAPDLTAIIEANHGPSIYDRLYSHPNAPDHRNDFEELLARIAPPETNDNKKKDRNGLVKTSKLSNPYKKLYVNGSRRSGSVYSGLSSEESTADRPHKYRGKAIGSSTDDDVKKAGTSPKKKATLKIKGKKSPKKLERKKKKAPQSKAIIESSSEEETTKSKSKQEGSQSNTLQKMEREMAAGKTGESGTDSEEFMPMRSTRNNKFTMDIYSDSSEETSAKTESKSEQMKSDKIKHEKTRQESSPNGNDSQQQLPRTKAAMKEFIPAHLDKKSPDKSNKPTPKKRGRKPSNKDKVPIKSNGSDDDAKNKENITISKHKDNPTDLIVPQRQAAKKASENMRSTTIPKKEELVSDKQTSSDENKSKPKMVKSKEKEINDKPAKIGRKRSAKDIEKEPISYVPQRQAAKKAAAHIKSGMGSKVPATVETVDSEKKRDNEKPECTKSFLKKDSKVSKTPQKEESSSSSTNSSTSNYSSSSSSDEEEKPEIKPTAKAREIKPATRQPSMFSPQPIARPTVDLPFLDKVSRPLSSTSASSDSDSSKASRDSGSSSPSPKRPRRRRKGKSISTDTSPRKAPDKKLKTSERVSECGISSPSFEGEESGRPSNARAAMCIRTRSTTSSGNMPDAGQRKPSKDGVSHSIGPNKTPKESCQSNKLSTPERKVHEEIKTEVNDDVNPEATIDLPKDINKPSKKLNVSLDEKDKSLATENVTKNSPKKNVEIKLKNTPCRRMSVKDQPKDPSTSLEEVIDVITKNKRLNKFDQGTQNSSNLKTNVCSIARKLNSEKPVNFDSKIPSVSDSFPDNEKHWLPKPPSPNVNLPQIEKPGEHEKYMTEDKSLDSDSADKSSIKMIARIQANLNENTMIKSPKTPMDARMSIEPIDTDSPLIRNITKRSLIDSEKKFMAQDSSHVQGVEISKRAKIPSAASQFTRSIFSPQHKDDFFSLDILNDDEGFNHDDSIKPFTDLIFKDDSKEKSVQETRNLVDRLRMQLNSKQAPADSAKHESNSGSNNKDDSEEANNVSSISHVELSAPSNIIALEFESKEIVVNEDNNISINHVPHRAVSNELAHRASDIVNQPLSMTSNDKWADLPIPVETTSKDRTYDHTRPNEIKESTSIQTDLQSEMGDNLSLSKQSDDSQPLSVVDHSIHSNDQDFTRDTQTYDNNNSLIHSDCATIQSPYVSEDTKWRESKITTRRSSASSTNSDESVCSQKTDLKSHMNSCDSHQSNIISDTYPPIPPYSCHQYPSYPPETSPFLSTIGTLPLFPPGGCSSQLPLSSPAPGLFVPYSTKPLLPPMPKPTFPTLCAAFTTSSQNIAITTAMIAPPTPKPIDSPRDDIDVTGSDKFSIHVSSPSISVDSFNDSSNARPLTKSSNDSNDAISNLQIQEPKSLIKTSKSLSKFSGKSPGKSPGISPKQTEGPKNSKRPSNRNNRSQRGRGRSKSRGQGIHSYLPTDYIGNSIQDKLVGTVYDFDQEIANDGVDLKSLREKRKSVDMRDDRKSDHSYKELSQSPHVASPQQSSKRTPVETKEVSTPGQSETKEPSASSSRKSSSERGPGFSQVQPVLPGPVDMRTYHSCENTAPVVAGDGFHSHLLAFASGTADQHLAEIDEEVEKQLHSALMASKSRPSSPSAAPMVPAVNEPPKETFVPQLPKVSLSDSRNQLKVKIKGPFLDANYSTSSVQPVVTQPPPPIHESSTNTVMGISSGASSSMMTGSTNLRRMRKKELLRQYWTQDMNMDDPSNNLTIGIAPPPAAPIPLARAVITIPKAVASMTSIPTREDYKMTESPAVKKKRKTSSGLSRELRHLEVSMNDDVDPSDDIKLPTFATNPVHKRRGRVTNKLNQAGTTLAGGTKLKIKLGSNTVQQVNEEPCGYQFRPPKKRIMNIPKPSLADIRRENMKYRRKIMADFEDDEKPKKDKTSKSEKRKKKKEKKQEKEQLRVINRDSDSATKLIIKIKRTKEQDSENSASTSGVLKSGAMAAAAAAPEPPVDPFHYDPMATDPLAIDPPSYSEASAVMRKIRTAKVTPIRLKLARSSQGSGYVMKGADEKRAAPEAAATSAPAPPSASAHILPLTDDKHSDMR